MSVQPIQILSALEDLLGIYGEDEVYTPAAEYVVVYIMDDANRAFDLLFDERPIELSFMDLDPTPEALEVFLELQDAAGNDFTLGELYDGVADRLMPTLEVTA